MWKRIQRFRKLGGPARGVFLRAAAMLPLIALSLRLRGFRSTQAFLQRFLSKPNDPTDVSAFGSANLTARMVRAATRHTLGRTTCLEESLALWWLLGRQGIGSDLRVGVRKEREKFEAHAWVERDGTALNEPEAKHLHYAAFDAALASMPPGSR